MSFLGTAQYTYGNRPVIPVQLKDSSGNYQTVQALFDTGNDISIISQKTANQLGITGGDSVKVVGIEGGGGSSFARTQGTMKFGDTTPIKTDMLIGQTDVNLIGRKDVLDKFDVKFSPGNQIQLIQRAGFCTGSYCQA